MKHNWKLISETSYSLQYTLHVAHAFAKQKKLGVPKKFLLSSQQHSEQGFPASPRSCCMNCCFSAIMGRCDPSAVETPKMYTLQTTRTLVLFGGISFWDTAFSDDHSEFFFSLFEWLVYCSQGIVRSSRSNGTITRLP